MKFHTWEHWLNKKNILENDFKSYIKKKIIRKGATSLEIQGHLKKAKRNLQFSRKVIDEFKDYYEWAITSYYYAVYHAALSLCASIGYKTKSHRGTICLLIKFFYPDKINW